MPYPTEDTEMTLAEVIAAKIHLEDMSDVRLTESIRSRVRFPIGLYVIRRWGNVRVSGSTGKYLPMTCHVTMLGREDGRQPVKLYPEDVLMVKALPG